MFFVFLFFLLAGSKCSSCACHSAASSSSSYSSYFCVRGTIVSVPVAATIVAVLRGCGGGGGGGGVCYLGDLEPLDLLGFGLGCSLFVLGVCGRLGPRLASSVDEEAVESSEANSLDRRPGRNDASQP